MGKPDTPVDWEAMEPHFRAGILSYRQLADRFNVAPSAIVKHFSKRGITRDLKARIQAKAAEKVNAAAVNAAVNAEAKAITEAVTVEANATLVATVALGQRRLADKTVKVIGSLLDELEATIDAPEVFGQVHGLLAAGEDPDTAQLQRIADLVSSLPERTKLASTLVESVNRAIAGQRRVYGMDDDQKSADTVDSFENLLDRAEHMLAKTGYKP